METEKIIFETEIKTGNSAGSVKSLKAELRSLTNELANLEPGSQAFLTAATRAGTLQDKMEDAKNAVKAFNPEAKFQAFANVVGGVANGFAAAQGAMALFGSDSKDLEKVMAKTQGAIALATGLNGLLGMGDSFKLLKAQMIQTAGVIKTSVVSAFATLKASIISTGIGALVIAIGLAINEIMNYNQAIQDETDKQKKLNDELEKTKDLMEKTASASEKKRNAQKGGLDDLKREKDLLIAKGATDKEVFEKTQKILEKELFNLKTRKYSGLEVTKEIADKENEIKVNQLEFDKKIKEKEKVQQDKDKAIRDKKYEEAKADYEFFRNLTKKNNDKDNEERAKDYDKKIADEKFFADFVSELDAQAEEDARTRAKAEIEIEKQKNEAKIKQLDITANALSGFADLAGRETAAGKALAIASTTISTYMAAQQAYASAFLPVPTAASPFIGALSAAAAVASGLANIRAIMAVQVPKGGGGGGGSMPSVNAAAPIVRPSSNMVNIGNGSPIKTSNEGGKMKVYVLESDITSTQKNVDSIRQKATIK